MLTKLLMMTTSSHDGEALVAIRKANEMLARDCLNWQDVMKRLQSAKPYEAPEGEAARGSEAARGAEAEAEASEGSR